MAKVKCGNPIEVITVGIEGPPGPVGAGVPPGGHIGQILAKNSEADYDTIWIDPPIYNPASLPSFLRTVSLRTNGILANGATSGLSIPQQLRIQGLRA